MAHIYLVTSPYLKTGIIQIKLSQLNRDSKNDQEKKAGEEEFNNLDHFRYFGKLDNFLQNKLKFKEPARKLSSIRS